MWCGSTSASCARSPTHPDAIAAGIFSRERPAGDGLDVLEILASRVGRREEEE